MSVQNLKLYSDDRIDDILIIVYKLRYNKFFLRIRKYFWGIPITMRETTVEDCEAAEDFLSNLNVDYPKIVQLRNSVRELFNKLEEN